jgi:regulator of cell morphogenesis and NO signaling
MSHDAAVHPLRLTTKADSEAALDRRPVGRLVAEHPAWAVVFDRLGIDYCCHGAIPLDEACAAAGVDIQLALAELRTIDPGSAGCPSLLEASIDEVIDHVLQVHHAYCHRHLPHLAELVAKVARVHGERHPELAEVHATFTELHGELASHLAREEQVVLPMCRAVAGQGSNLYGPDVALTQPIRVLLAEHDVAGDLLARLQRLTHGFGVPADGCASYAAMLSGLRAFDADLHRHVHEENNILFPAVLRRSEAQSAPRAAAS